MSTQYPHSADVLNDTRDYWWNPDFVALMAKRWELNQVKSMLDVGCGLGHWGQMLATYLPADATIKGIDPESLWVAKATARASLKGLGSRAEYCVGSAENIPFPDNHFDMVTCQTVLMHISDVPTAIKEMIRVLKPGGLLAAAEPNHLGMALNNLTFHDPVDNIVELFRTYLICARGKAALKEGDNNTGDILPNYFYLAGLKNISVYINDLSNFFVPPYASPREHALVEQVNAVMPADLDRLKEEMLNYYLAGGGTLPEFEHFWQQSLSRRDRIKQGYNEQTLCYSGGDCHYLVSGRKAI